MEAQDIRNIAIIAHVDHGKTTLVDRMLQAGGVFRENQAVNDRIMDSMDLEREKGITIQSKNTSIRWQNKTINIVDTPGHADFGAEVERVMKMVDGVLLLVDAYEGPQAQTRFVLRKAIENELTPIIVINKVDRPNSDPVEVYNQVLELFLELEATEEQFHAACVYASAKDGWADLNLQGPRQNLDPLFSSIIGKVPPPKVVSGSFRMLVSNIQWDDFVGRVSIGKIYSGLVRVGDPVYVRSSPAQTLGPFKITKIFSYSGLRNDDSEVGLAGDIVGVAGIEEVEIGATLALEASVDPLPFVVIDPPTIQMEFVVNDGPLAGRDGKKVTSRQIRDRLMREKRTNVALRVEDTEDSGRFLVSARGAMQVAILVETMRREGYEILVSRPGVITRRGKNGGIEEPFETLWVESPDECLGGIMKNIAARRGKILNMRSHHGNTTLEASIPTRGLIGFEFDLVNETSGRGVMSHLFEKYDAHCGEIVVRQTGTLVSMENGKATSYALDALDARGRLFIEPGDDVYEGMIVGENPRRLDLPVNPTKAKQLTNFRAAGKDKSAELPPPLRFSLERAIEYIAGDELVEATPRFLRLRKRTLDTTQRRKADKNTRTSLRD